MHISLYSSFFVWHSCMHTHTLLVHAYIAYINIFQLSINVCIGFLYAEHVLIATVEPVILYLWILPNYGSMKYRYQVDVLPSKNQTLAIHGILHNLQLYHQLSHWLQMASCVLIINTWKASLINCLAVYGCGQF